MAQSDTRQTGDQKVQHYSFVKIDHEISTLPLIQEGQLSVGERMYKFWLAA